MNFVFRTEPPHEERRGRVVPEHIILYSRDICVRVAVSAQVPAGVVLTDIICDVTGAFLPIAGIGRQGQIA